MHLVFLTPSPDPAGGGSGFNAGLIPALRALDHTVDLRHDTANLPSGAVPVVDGLLLPDLEPALAMLVACDAVAVVHHVGARAGRAAEMRERVLAIEKRMLPALRRVVATSGEVAGRLATEFGIAPMQLGPGLPDLPRSAGSGGPGCHLVSVGVMTPRKGHDRLLRALARLVDLDWTLTIAGDATRDPVHATGLAGLVDELDLQGRVTIVPDPSLADLDGVWASADLFVLASSWEGYPAGIAEALRRGVPVVALDVGGVGAMVPQSAGVLAPLDDLATFGKCLRRAVYDGGLRTALAQGAWHAGVALPGWPQQALAFLAIMEG